MAIKRINKFLNSEEIDPDAVSHDPRRKSVTAHSKKFLNEEYFKSSVSDRFLAEPIIVENGQFSWDGYEGLPTLVDISLTVQPGSLVAVVGPVGSGKSSLLSAFLGEMYKQSGSVNTHVSPIFNDKYHNPRR